MFFETAEAIDDRQFTQAILFLVVMFGAVALAWKWHLRLLERGRDVRQFPMVFIYLVVAAVKSGRRLAGTAKAKDAMNRLTQRRQRDADPAVEGILHAKDLFEFVHRRRLQASSPPRKHKTLLLAGRGSRGQPL